MGRPKKTHLGPPSVHKGRERVWWNGAWHDLGEEGSAEARAKYGRLAAQWVVDPSAPVRDPDEYLVGELCADYLDSRDAPPEGLQRERVVVAVQLLLQFHAKTPALAFGPKDLRAWQDWLCQLPGVKKPDRLRFAATTVHYHVDSIRRAFKWAVSQERIPPDRYDALATVPRTKFGEAREPKTVDPADPAHVRATLPFLRPQPRAMVVLQLASGARPGEVCGMTPGEVFRGGVINVKGAGRHDLDKLGVWAYVPSRHKLTSRRKPRVLMFAGEAKEVLQPYLDRPADKPCFSPRESVEAMWAEQRAAREADPNGGRGNRHRIKRAPKKKAGERYDHKSYWTAVTQACDRAGVPRWFPYQLRHLAAAEIQELFGLAAVQALLGHHTKSQAEHYAGLAVKEAAKVAQARGGATPISTSE